MHIAAERLRLFDQRRDDVAIINNHAAIAAAAMTHARQLQHLGGAQIADEPVVIDMNLKAMADQARRHGVIHIPNGDRAGARDHCADDGEVGRLELRQWRHRRKLQSELGASARIAPPCHLGEIHLPRYLTERAPKGRSALMRESSLPRRRGVRTLFIHRNQTCR